MAIDMVLDKIDNLDEETQKLYKKQGEKFVLDVSGDVSSHPEVEKLSKALSKERESVKELKNNLNEFKESFKDIDPAKVAEMQTQLSEYQQQQKEQERKKAENKEQWDKLEKDLREQHQQELQSYQKKIEDLDSQNKETIQQMQSSLEREIKEKGVVSAIAEHKGNQTILKPHVESQVKVVNEDGEYAARVVDEKGQPRINNQGQPMSISELITEFKSKPEFQGDGIFEKEKHDGGSGSNGNRGYESHKTNPWKDDQFNLTEQSKIYKENPQLADQLKQEAGKG